MKTLNDAEDLLKDLDKAFDLINRLEEAVINDEDNLDNIKEEANKLKSKLEKKHSDSLDTKK